MQDDLTTLVCLFHHASQAQAAIRDLQNAGIPQSAVTQIGGDGQGVDALDKSELSELGMPDRDYDHLKQGIRDGGYVIAVASIADHVSAVESIFGKHQATKIDEAETASPETGAAPLAAAVPAASLAAVPLAAEADLTDGTVIPIVQEDLVVGKRTVDQGGVRLYRRVVEVPVETSVDLREEHVSVQRVPVDRAITGDDAAFQERSIALTETAEEAVISKDARVVEEIYLGKETTQHTETVRDSVRHTEVDVEELPGTGATAGKPTRTY